MVGETYSEWDADAMLDALPEWVVRYSLPDVIITYCNTAWAAAFGVEPAQAVGRRLDEFLSEDGREGLNSQLALLGPDNPVLDDCVARAVTTSPGKWVQWVDRYLTGGRVAEVLSIGRDVTGRHDAELKLAASEARFRNLADNSSDVVWHFLADPYPHFDYVSPSVENSLGYPQSFFLDNFASVMEILDDEGRAVIVRSLRGEPMPDRQDFRFRHADGSIVIGESQTTLIPGGMQGVSRNVTELRHLQEKLAALALRDPLTGLANRRLFDELLDADLARTQRSDVPLALAYLDLDDLKTVNDTYGHEAGDVVLCETARRLLSVVRGADTVARLGGDEFVVVYEPNDPSSDNLIERIDAALSAPIGITSNIEVGCPASIGVADTRTIGRDPAELLAAADAAMYEAKRARHAARTASKRRAFSDAIARRATLRNTSQTVR